MPPRPMVAVEGASAAERGADQQKLLQNVQLSLVTQMSALSKHFGDEQRKYLPPGPRGGGGMHQEGGGSITCLRPY